MKPTKEQQAIYDFVQNGRGNAIVDAVAGAGKTTTIMECAKHIPEHRRQFQNRNNVLFCAFNRNIVGELKQKFKEQGVNYVDVKTCHSLGLQILRDRHKIAEDKEPVDNKCKEIVHSDDFIKQVSEDLRVIYDYRNEFSLDSSFFIDLFAYVEASPKRSCYATIKKRNPNLAKIIDSIIVVHNKYRLTLSTDNKNEFYENVLEHFGIFNCHRESKNEYPPSVDEVITAYMNVNQELYKRSLALAEKGEIDYVDMLYLPHLWKLEPVWHYQYIFIDECQDLSKARQEIILKYQYANFCRIIAVGDPHQAIYGFDGADITSFDTMAERINANRFSLYGSFRCPKRVVAKAKEINPNIQANRAETGYVRKATPRNYMYRYLAAGDMVIARKKATLFDLVWHYLYKGVMLSVVPEVRHDIIAKIKSMFKEEEFELPIDKENYWPVRKAILKRNKDFILDRPPYPGQEDEWIECRRVIQYILNILRKQELPTIKQAIERFVNTYLPEKVKEEDLDKVINVLTIHRAKGLQAKRVFVLDADQLPFSYNNMLDWEKLQESNLTYVAYTRAESNLFLVLSEQPEFEDSAKLQKFDPWEDDALLNLSDDELAELFAFETTM